MQIVIDISDIDYNDIKEYGTILDECRDDIAKAIINGIPLPKGHGRLVDADKLWDSYHDLDYDFYEAFDLADTILEADKSEGEK